MASRNANPFEQEGPTPYEHWNYIVGQAHAGILVELATKMELLTEQLKQHNEAHRAANAAALEMPPIKQSEKTS